MYGSQNIADLWKLNCFKIAMNSGNLKPSHIYDPLKKIKRKR